jgi:hypothetical protein
MPEHWETDAGDQGVAHLDIPADAFRDRTFEVAVDFSVVALPDAEAPWHELRVLVNGALQWSRRVPTHPEGGDSLDYRMRRTIPSGEPLRVTAVTEAHRVRRRRLRVVADED